MNNRRDDRKNSNYKCTPFCKTFNYKWLNTSGFDLFAPDIVIMFIVIVCCSFHFDVPRQPSPLVNVLFDTYSISFVRNNSEGKL